jgi:hypothetical protein
MSSLYRGPAIDASYLVSVHLAKWFQRRRFLKIGQSETRIAYVCLLMLMLMFVNGSAQNEQSLESTFHQCFLPSFTSFGWGVSEEKMWKVNRRRTTSDGKSPHCLWQGELKKKIERCYSFFFFYINLNLKLNSYILIFFFKSFLKHDKKEWALNNIMIIK